MPLQCHNYRHHTIHNTDINIPFFQNILLIIFLSYIFIYSWQSRNSLKWAFVLPYPFSCLSYIPLLLPVQSHLHIALSLPIQYHYNNHILVHSNTNLNIRYLQSQPKKGPIKGPHQFFFRFILNNIFALIIKKGPTRGHNSLFLFMSSLQIACINTKCPHRSPGITKNPRYGHLVFILFMYFLKKASALRRQNAPTAPHITSSHVQ